MVTGPNTADYEAVIVDPSPIHNAVSDNSSGQKLVPSDTIHHISSMNVALDPHSNSETPIETNFEAQTSLSSEVTGPNNADSEAGIVDPSLTHNAVSDSSSAQKLVPSDTIHHNSSMNVALDLPSTIETPIVTNFGAQTSPIHNAVSDSSSAQKLVPSDTIHHNSSMNVALDLPSNIETPIETNVEAQTSLSSEVNSLHATGTQQQEVITGRQTTLLNFLSHSHKSRSRSLVKEDAKSTRRRFSSKRKGASPTDTPKSKRLSKKKRQGAVSGKTGSSSGNKETVSESVTEVRKVTVESVQITDKPSQTMDWWLNQPSPS